MVGVTKRDDEVITVDKDDSGTEVVSEIVKLEGVALLPVCVDMVGISVVVVRMEVKVAEEITTVVGVPTETTVVVNEGDSVDVEESGGFFLPPSSSSSSEHIRIIHTRTYMVQNLGKRTVLVLIAFSIVSFVFVTTLLLGSVTSSPAIVPISIIIVLSSTVPITSELKCR